MKTLISESGAPLSYLLPDDRVAAGASLGNSAIWTQIKSNGSVERIFSTRRGTNVTGSITIQYAGVGGPLVRHADRSSETTADAGHVPLRQEATGEFQLDPACQQHRFVLPGEIHVVETIFVPLGPIDREGGDPSLLYQSIRLENRSRHPASLRVTAFGRMRGDSGPDIEIRFDESVRALVASNASDPSNVRVFGTTAPLARHAATSDFGSAYDPLLAKTLDGDVSATGDVLACLQSDFDLAPGDTIRFAVVTGIYDSLDEARRCYPKRERGETALARTEQHLREVLRVSEVLTPDRQVNLGAAWSKVNMRRVMARYPTGSAFTNEPGVSSNVVARDAAWFTIGCDHFMPVFSRALLDMLASLQYPSGKIPEYYNALDRKVEDYGLNINDDTPLFMHAVNHHFRSTGDLDWLRRIFPAVEKSAKYIDSQVDERGLVVCTANDPRGNVWGIAGWRNIIEGYRINGAVTEINALCAAALRSAHHLAQNVGLSKKQAAWLSLAYERIRDGMERHLRNPENGLYYLNIDVDGVKHSDVTGDELFPVMFRVCDDETGYRIVSRLNAPDFWTRAGLRTVSRDDPLYEPTKMTGLLGGVWPGLTWWYGFAAARYHPEFMVRALRSSFVHYAQDAAAHNTVPGEFSEWFDGETLVNRGMRLSPWEPPRFLWAAIEGVCGFTLSPETPRINPLIPPSWRWVGLRRLPFHGEELSYFAVRQEGDINVFATCEVETKNEAHEYEEDITDSIVVLAASASTIGLRRGSQMMIMVGNSGMQTTNAPVDLSRVVDVGKKYELRVYNSERDAWLDASTLAGSQLQSIAVPIEVLGFRLLSLKETD